MRLGINDEGMARIATQLRTGQDAQIEQVGDPVSTDEEVAAFSWEEFKVQIREAVYSRDLSRVVHTLTQVPSRYQGNASVLTDKLITEMKNSLKQDSAGVEGVDSSLSV